ncbi:nucleoside hydrolase [Belnapia sp. T6]|uniref:Nucleoside hydrolase n=1 Tax=Belnapia mucosa TaxID=2804532 RepID=A0ABS1VCZ7_9PROT|nr:nucleoside hydrolase [Belnapia mucosa]MBL6459523.1 nucleoside hydrolase [Belnapia mucosa]
MMFDMLFSVPNFGWTRSVVLAAGVALGACVGCHPAEALSADSGSCLIIDSDAGLDDFRAVAALGALGPSVPARKVAAIITTEGVARSPEGAGAMERFLKNAGLTIPVIQGVLPNPKRRFTAEHPLDPRLPIWRKEAELLNLTLPEVERQANPAGEDVAVLLRRHTETCTSISLLVIGPWTSFLRYAPDILGRIERIVVQGRPYPDELGGEPAGFNCTYDVDSCLAAFDLLVGRQQRGGRRFRATWVDIPQGPEACAKAEPGVNAEGEPLWAFAPVESWENELRELADRYQKGEVDRGQPARAVAGLLRNRQGLANNSLWDDLAALFLIRPELFAVRGGHVEPCVPAATVRANLSAAMILPERLH